MATLPVNRKITGSFAGPDFAFALGEIVTFPPGAPIPATILQNSEPFGGTVPHDATRFDPRAWAFATQPRPEPVEPPRLDEADVMRRFGWTPADITAAHVALGFPQPYGTRANGSTVLGLLLGEGQSYRVTRFWLASTIAAWEAGARALGFQFVTGGTR